MSEIQRYVITLNFSILNTAQMTQEGHLQIKMLQFCTTKYQIAVRFSEVRLIGFGDEVFSPILSHMIYSENRNCSGCYHGRI